MAGGLQSNCLCKVVFYFRIQNEVFLRKLRYVFEFLIVRGHLEIKNEILRICLNLLLWENLKETFDGELFAWWLFTAS